MPLPNADQFVGQNVTESGFKQAQTQLIQFLGDEVPTNEKLVNTFATKAIADSKTTLMPIDYKVTVTSDPDETKNGDYTWNGTELVKSPYDPVDKSRQFTSEEVGKVSADVKEKFEKIKLSTSSESTSVIPVLVDRTNKTLIGYDTEKDRIAAGGLQEQVLENLPNLKKSEDTGKIAVLTDSTHKILIGYDTEKDQAIIAGIEFPNQKPLVKAVNHMLWYGESFSVGQKGTPPISVQQPYSNITFDSTVRLINGTATATKSLVEDAGTDNPPVQVSQGETCCSGAANYASRAMMLENGIDPNAHIIFASTAGHGSYRIDQLVKASAWYPTLINHVTQAMSLVGSDYKVQCIPFIQGANDAAAATRTPKSIYKPKLKQLRIDADADIKSVTQQPDDIKFIIAQMSYGTRAWSDQALSHLELVKEDEGFCMATPMYHFPYDADGVHLTNIGYKWISAYFGRAYKQLIVENRQPDFINPIVAQLIGDEVHINFEVPKAPLVIDTATLAATTDNGFKVLANGAAVTISNITTQDDKVILKLSAIPTGSLKVRYALDYLGSGINLTEGASGNLRDSTNDVVAIDGGIKPLYHVCPHFELTVFTDKGI
ncbi:TPA: SGNH/GDSL hydrolase family protein [Acinetobacter baumannii]|nr:SGNH/GDSL hydrolase family protein [Acinetobacter baumannii]